MFHTKMFCFFLKFIFVTQLVVYNTIFFFGKQCELSSIYYFFNRTANPGYTRSALETSTAQKKNVILSTNINHPTTRRVCKYLRIRFERYSCIRLHCRLSEFYISHDVKYWIKRKNIIIII